MCIRCLEGVYTFHADKIGAFQEIVILLVPHSMASTRSVEPPHRLLVGTDEDSFGKINIPDNAEQLLNLESIGQ
jgi:hypothetical protein